MSKISAWMPFYVNDYVQATRHLSLAENGAYVCLLAYAWVNGSIPNDEIRISRILGVGIREWRQVAPAVLEFFTDTDGKLTQKRQEAERAKALEIVEKRAIAGAEGAAKRWGKSEAKVVPEPDGEDGNTNGKPIANAMANASQTDAQSQSHLPREESKKETPSLRSVPLKRRERLPNDWAPSISGLQKAHECGIMNPDSEAQKFRDHHAAKGSLMADWDAAWRTWVANAQRFAPRGKQAPSESPLDRMIRAERMAAAHEDETPTFHQPRITLQ